MRTLVCCLLLLASGSALPAAAGSDVAEDPWYAREDGAVSVHLYFFWTRTCPHCTRARPDVAAIAREMPWLVVHSHELTASEENVRRYLALTDLLGEPAGSVPAFLFCGRMLVGYDDASGVGAELRSELADCFSRLSAGESLAPAADQTAAARLPLLGKVDLASWSLPLVAVTLGALDSFNPCAFFVLLFLLSLLVNARSRRRMLLVGGVFVSVSGLVYFLFMAAWLNVFLLVGQLAWITLAAGGLALVIGAVNVKDYFRPDTGPTLGIPRSARPGLFRRMRRLLDSEHLPALIAGTLGLAVAANAYELLCTAGLPMVFTRVLTLNELPVTAYYGYLALYCAVYVIPLLAIVGAFTFTLGRRKLSEREGRVLKLLSGIMMAGLGMLLLAAPGLLTDPGAIVALLACALALTWLVVRLRPV